MKNSMYHKLLDTAQEMVQVNGFNAFSYGRLSEAVGIKTASIHYHFPGKENLGEALARRYREQFNIVLKRIKAENADAQTRIEQYAEQFLQTLKQGGKICLCGMLASDYATLPEKVQIQIRAFFTENEAWLTKVLKQGKKNGEFRFKCKAEDLAIAFFAMLEGAMLGARMFEGENRLQQAINCWQTALLIKHAK